MQTSISCVHDVVADPDSSRIVIADAQAEMKQQLERYRTIQRDYVAFLTDDKDMNEELKICQDLQSMCIKANISAGRAIERKTEEPSKKMTELKIKRMKMPTVISETIRALKTILRSKSNRLSDLNQPHMFLNPAKAKSHWT